MGRGIFLIFKAVLCSVALAAGAPTQAASAGTIRLPKPARSLLRNIQLSSVKYFQDEAHPVTGLVRDRARNQGKTPADPRYESSSIAATGFGFAVLSHAVRYGLADKAKVYDQLLKTTDFLFTVKHHKGWLPHFLHWDTGAPYGKTEISTIDTALFLAGALYAAEIFSGTELATKIHRLYERVDFEDMLTDGGGKPKKLSFSHGSDLKGRYLTAQWDTYSEQLILLILALGRPGITEKVWDAVVQRLPTDPMSSANVMGRDLSLFVHQYSHLFVDFKNFPSQGGALFENSRLATLENREHCLRQPNKTYTEGFWGLSATDTPDGYFAFSTTWDDGTVCPSCAGASIMFLPEIITMDLLAWWQHPNRGRFWGKYGMADSLNLDRDWVNPDAVGITVGPLYMAIANSLGAPTIWEDFMRLDIVDIARRKITQPRQN